MTTTAGPPAATPRATAAYRSPLLDRPGAVPADAPDDGVAEHLGDPLREQRAADAPAGAVVVDRSHRGVIAVDGADRLSWLHSLTTQHLERLPPWSGTEALVLDPHGRIEHHLVVADDGTTTWIDVEPGTREQLLAYLTAMRFMLRVEPRDATGERAVLSVVGAGAVRAVTGDAAVPPPGGVVAHGGVLVRRMPYGADLLVPRHDLAAHHDRLAAVAPAAGVGAFEAVRVAARRPRLGRETDHRTIPNELDWLGSAVHLQKGCYRGQETVARVHNLGRPPRRLVLLHLDGATVEHGTPVTAAGRTVGVVGTAVHHHELGPIALAVIKRSVPDGTPLVAGQVAAAIDVPG